MSLDGTLLAYMMVKRVDLSQTIFIHQMSLFNTLTLKMKVSDAEDLDENWQAMIPCQHACVQKNWHFKVQPFVCSRQM